MNITPSVSYMCFRLKIPNISKLREASSPEVILHGIPWKFLIKKTRHENKQLLGIYLYCEKEDKLANWSYAASASFKLLKFGDIRTDGEEYMKPFVFDQVEPGFGTTSFITWDDLFDVDKNYVKDDTVNLELKIDVADPFGESRSQLKFVRHSNTKFRLMVTNINNLMATRSPPFMFKKVPFNLIVYKSHSSHLGVYLYQRGALKDVPFRCTMSAKLMTSNDRIRIVKTTQTDTIRHGTLYIEKIMSWNEILDSRNAFVDNNSIIIEVELM